jgi:hypothetical protein
METKTGETSELGARLAADPSLTSLVVAFYLSDGSTARSTFKWDGKPDAIEAVENLLTEKLRLRSSLAVDSLDSDQTTMAERFIRPEHVVAYVVTAA